MGHDGMTKWTSTHGNAEYSGIDSGESLALKNQSDPFVHLDCKYGLITGVDMYPTNEKESLLVLGHLERQI